MINKKSHMSFLLAPNRRHWMTMNCY